MKLTLLPTESTGESNRPFVSQLHTDPIPPLWLDSRSVLGMLPES